VVRDHLSSRVAFHVSPCFFFFWEHQKIRVSKMDEQGTGGRSASSPFLLNPRSLSALIENMNRHIATQRIQGGARSGASVFSPPHFDSGKRRHEKALGSGGISLRRDWRRDFFVFSRDVREEGQAKENALIRPSPSLPFF